MKQDAYELLLKDKKRDTNQFFWLQINLELKKYEILIYKTISKILIFLT